MSRGGFWFPVGGGLLLAVGCVAMARQGVDPAGVVADDHATAHDVVVAARSPEVVAEATDGSLLAVYVIADESGERTKGAVRLVDPRGTQVMARLAPSSDRPIAAGDGFALVDETSGRVTTVETDGTTARVPSEGRVAAVGPDDVLVASFRPARVFSPSSGRVESVTGLPSRTEQVLVDHGRLWSIGRAGDLATVATSTDGRVWQPSTWSLPSPQWLGDASAYGNRLAVVTITSDDDSAATGVRVVTSGEMTSFELPERTPEPNVTVLPDGAVVAGLPGGTWWVWRGTDVVPLDLPGVVDTFTISNGHVYAIGERVWRSTDSARTWSSVDL